jgi:hypothetical protein
LSVILSENRNTTFRDHALEAGRRSLALQESAGKLAQFACKDALNKRDALAGASVAGRRPAAPKCATPRCFALGHRAGEDLTSAQQLAVKLGLGFSPQPVHGGKRLKSAELLESSGRSGWCGVKRKNARSRLRDCLDKAGLRSLHQY